VRIGDDWKVTVYEHPWEAEEEYATMLSGGAASSEAVPDDFKVPRAPLSLGDTGPRVMHLHYVLYKMGYLRLCNESLRVGEYCEETRNTVARFQRDHQLICDGTPSAASPALAAAGGGDCGDLPGVFTVVTRRAILNLFREVETRYSQVRCRSSRRGQSLNLQTAVAA
jgi:peptidoglycan hydrolase-like protein with peptidoglycan-binding domain